MNDDNNLSDKVHTASIPPQNAEHLEAIQADFDALKALQMNQMEEEDRRRLEKIEQCVKMLEEAKIPFLLFGSVDPTGTTQFGPRSWWQYNCFAYPEEGEDPFEAKVKRSAKSAGVVVPLANNFISSIYPLFSIVVCGPNREILSIHEKGKMVYPSDSTDRATK